MIYSGSIYDIYQTMWEQAAPQLSDNHPECDPFLRDRTRDTRRGMGMVAYIPEPARSRIIELIEAARTLEPGQYYYHPQELHVTILSLFTCFPDFSLTRLDLSAYTDRIVQAIETVPPIHLDFQGISASPSCILIQGFPTDDTLNLFRDRLRAIFKQSSLEHTIDRRYAIQTAHSTVIRFTTPFNNAPRFMELLETYRDYPFGTVEIAAVELMFHDWYLAHDVTQSLATFHLPGMNRLKESL